MEVKLTLYIESNKTRQDLLNDIDNTWKRVQEFEETFKMYAVANPKDITPTDYDPIGYIQGQMTDQLEFYREAVMNYRRALDFLDAYDDYQDEYKPGDTVQVRSGLTPDTQIGGIYCNQDMVKLSGQAFIIESVEREKGYILKGIPFYWSDAMLKLLVSKEDNDARHATGDPR